MCIRAKNCSICLNRNPGRQFRHAPPDLRILNAEQADAKQVRSTSILHKCEMEVDLTGCYIRFCKMRADLTGYQ